MDFFRGQRIGKYEVVTQLTLGGMAEIFLAFTSGPGGFRKYVVLKRILPDVKGQEHFVRMFLDEARITAQFAHPNIAQVFDLGDDDGLYLAMEFIPGQNVNQVSSACRRRQTPIPFGFSCAVVRDVCHALHYAHTFVDPTGKPSPVIHRDVAQKNVMVTYDGLVKLLDFGVAKARGKLQRTNAGVVKGTTGYMSPEQVRAERLDGRSDVFCAGVMLHELLTGKRLFAAPTETDEMVAILEAPIPRPASLNPDIPEALDEAVMRALARERSDRFATARELAKAIDRAVGQILFDQEQLSAFMRELFEEKVAATRQLLESAGVEDAAASVDALVKAMRGADEEMSFTEQTVVKPSARAGATRLLPAATEEQVALSAQLDSVTAEAGQRRFNPWSAVGVMIVLAGAAWWMYREQDPPPVADERGMERPEPGRLPNVVAFKGPELKPFVDPRTVDAGRVAVAPPEPEPTPPPPAAVEAPEPLDSARGDRKKGRGTFTLITQPECEVRRGKTVIGRTPLFNAQLPVGTHLLTLVGPDGKARRLSVPIKSGKNTAFRLALSELPE